MSSVTRPRGPLPSRVYWTRRIVLLVLALALVFGIAHLLGAGGGDGGGESAKVVGATPVPTGPEPTGAAAPPGPSASGQAGSASAKGAGTPKKSKKPKKLAEPQGPCEDSDVKVTPAVKDAHAGGGIVIVLKLTTRSTPACTWEVSPDSVILKLTSGQDPIWSSQECPRAIPTQAVVPRREHADRVRVVWNGKRSDAECSRATDWAYPGWYHAEAVARGSVHPVDVQFELQGPVRPTITPTPTPTPEPTGKPTKQRGAKGGTASSDSGGGRRH